MAKKIILVPVDGSPYSMRAAQYALKIAALMDAKILVLHCHKAFPSVLREPYFQQAIDKIIEKSNQLLLPYRQVFEKSGLAFEVRTLEGPARKTIVRVAQKEDFEMIVMGTRGLTDLAGMVLGSVTHRVLHSVSCPVLVVK